MKEKFQTNFCQSEKKKKVWTTAPAKEEKD